MDRIMDSCCGTQMIARIHTKVRAVREMIHKLLVNIGRHHPQVRRILSITRKLTPTLFLTLTLRLTLIVGQYDIPALMYSRGSLR